MVTLAFRGKAATLRAHFTPSTATIDATLTVLVSSSRSGCLRRFRGTWHWCGPATIDNFLLAGFHIIETIIVDTRGCLCSNPASNLFDFTHPFRVSRIHQEAQALDIVAAILFTILELSSGDAQAGLISCVNIFSFLISPWIGCIEWTTAFSTMAKVLVLANEAHWRFAFVQRMQTQQGNNR